MDSEVPQEPHPSIREPKTLAEAKTLVGAVIWKRFDDNQLCEGHVQDVDTEVELDDGSIERQGPYYYIVYCDDEEQSEHVLWPEMSHLLHKAADMSESKKRKSSAEEV